MIYLPLQCSICNYIPDDNDIKYMSYKVGKCPNCGKENICDSCLIYDILNSEFKCMDCIKAGLFFDF